MRAYCREWQALDTVVVQSVRRKKLIYRSGKQRSCLIINKLPRTHTFSLRTSDALDSAQENAFPRNINQRQRFVMPQVFRPQPRIRQVHADTYCAMCTAATAPDSP